MPVIIEGEKRIFAADTFFKPIYLGLTDTTEGITDLNSFNAQAWLGL